MLVPLLVAWVAPIVAQRPVALTAVRELRIGGDVVNFVPVRGLAISATGRIAVMQVKDQQIRVFGPTGADQGRFGRRGEGPGEFLGLFEIGWRGDSLWAFDGA